MDFSPDLMLNILSKLDGKDEIEQVESIHCEPCVAENQNFLGKVLRLKVLVRHKTGQKTAHNVVVKRGDVEDTTSRFRIDPHMYTTEVRAYKYLDESYNWARRKTNKLEKFWPECLYSSIEQNPYLIMLQDLADLGYKMNTKKSRLLDEEEILITIETLAQVHAMSRLYVSTGNLDKSLWRSPNMSYLTDYFRHAFTVLPEAIRIYNEKWDYIADYIAKLPDTILDQYDSCNQSVKDSFTVLSLGDCWTNNILFKRSNTTGRVDSVRFIDLQLSHYNSLVWDLNFLLHISLLPSYRLDNMEKLLEKYQKTFSQTIQDLGGDPALAPSCQQLSELMDKLHLVAFIYSSLCTPELHFSTDEDYDELSKTSGFVKLDWLLKNPEENGFIRNVEYFESKGLFQKP